MMNYNVYQRNKNGKAIKVGRSIQNNPYAAEKAIANILNIDIDTLFAEAEYPNHR